MNYKYSLPTVIASLLIVSLVGCDSSRQLKQGREVNAMERRIINPWTWQDNFGMSGFVHANEITDAKRTLFTAGIVSVDGDGNLLHPGDMAKQADQIINNLGTILEQANFEFSDVVRFTYFTTDIEAFKSVAVQKVLIERLKNVGCRPATSLIGVQSLFHPDCVIEIEAILVN